MTSAGSSAFRRQDTARRVLRKVGTVWSAVVRTWVPISAASTSIESPPAIGAYPRSLGPIRSPPTYAGLEFRVGRTIALPPPCFRRGQLAHAAAGDAALNRRAINEGDAEDMRAVVADVVAVAGVVAATLKDITGLDLARMADRLRHRVALLRPNAQANLLGRLQVRRFQKERTLGPAHVQRLIHFFTRLWTLTKSPEP